MLSTTSDSWNLSTPPWWWYLCLGGSRIKFYIEYFIVSMCCQSSHGASFRRRVSVLTAIYCKENVFPWGWRGTLLYGHNTMSCGIFLIICPLSRLVIVDSPFGLMAYLVISVLVSLTVQSMGSISWGDHHIKDENGWLLWKHTTFVLVGYIL